MLDGPSKLDAGDCENQLIGTGTKAPRIHHSIAQIQTDLQSRMNRLVTPDCTLEEIERDVR